MLSDGYHPKNHAVQKHTHTSTYLCEDPADVVVCVTGVELPQQQLSRQTLGDKTGHSAAIVAVKNAIEEAAVLATDWLKRKQDTNETLTLSKNLRTGEHLGEMAGSEVL